MFQRIKQFVSAKLNQAKEKIYHKVPFTRYLFPGWGGGIPIPLKALPGSLIAILLPNPFRFFFALAIASHFFIHWNLWHRSRRLQEVIAKSRIDEIVECCSQGANPSETITFKDDINGNPFPVSIIESVQRDPHAYFKPTPEAIEVAQFFSENSSKEREELDAQVIASIKKAMEGANAIAAAPAAAVAPNSGTLLDRAQVALTFQNVPNNPPDSLIRYRKTEIESHVRNVLWSYMNICQKIQHTPEELARNISGFKKKLNYLKTLYR